MKHGFTADIGECIVEDMRGSGPLRKIGTEGKFGKCAEGILPQIRQDPEGCIKVAIALLSRLTEACDADKVFGSLPEDVLLSPAKQPRADIPAAEAVL